MKRDGDDFQDLTRGQVVAAMDNLDFAPERSLRFAPNNLHRITGYMPRGHLVVVAANTGVGKSTFAYSVIDDFVEAGEKVAFMGLEAQPDETRRLIAAVQTGVPSHVVRENSWREHPEGEEWFKRVLEAVVAQAQEPMMDRLLVLPQRYITPGTLEEAATQAWTWGATVLVIDHMNHSEDGHNYKEFARTVTLAKEVAEGLDIPLIAMAQVNREAMKGGHYLQRYQPVQLHQIQGGAVIEQNASIVLNPYRPVIVPQSKADEDRIKMAMKGKIKAKEVLQPWKTGVACLKHRIRGYLEGDRALLAVTEAGKLIDP